jgi:GTP:adenosylcobinamide-phosphate guanylyltransferase
VVALRVKPDVLSKYKALGRGYTSIMADVLNYVADNPEIYSFVPYSLIISSGDLPLFNKLIISCFPSCFA